MGGKKGSKERRQGKGRNEKKKHCEKVKKEGRLGK